VEIAEQGEKTGNEIWACIGVHPDHLEKSDNTVSALGHKDKALETVLSDFSSLVQSPKVVAIGECGLDYFRLDPVFAKATADKQKKLFESQIQFAIKYDKPLMLHVRSSGKDSFDAYEDALDILKNYKEAKGPEATKLRGNVHFFAADVSIAKRFLDLGFTMSFTGVITFTHDYDEVLKYLPQNSIMSETDAPWVAPVPWRGKRNEPAYVIEVVRKMAEIRGENLEALNNAIIENFKRVFLKK
jgi:TatD DNase family protein